MNGILHIEDDAEDSDTVRSLLWVRYDPIELTLMDSGEAAIRFLKESIRLHRFLPGVIILDLYMPDIDGKLIFEAIRGLGALYLIPIVILTSSNNPDDKAFFQSKSNVFYFEKPVQLCNYKLILDQVLDCCLA